MTTHTLSIASLLDAAPEAVWAQIGTMRGVNAELRPWLRMTYPAAADVLGVADAEIGRELFVSTLLFAGVLPFDRHRLTFERVTPGEGFAEESTSWTMRRWRHQRTLEPAEAGRTRLTDQLTFEPRMPGSAAISRLIVRALFAHRHDVLRRRFGGVESIPGMQTKTTTPDRG